MADWGSVPSEEVINNTVANLAKANMNAVVVENGAAALEELKKMIPEGSEIMTGSSTTLNQIGFTDLLGSEDSGWNSVHNKIHAENDEQARAELRRLAISSEFFLASPNAITEDGKIVAVDATGSRTGAMPFAAKNLILVAGANKIVPDLDAAFKRIHEYVFPLEDKRAMEAYGGGTSYGKWVIIESEKNPQRIKIVIIKESLGF